MSGRTALTLQESDCPLATSLGLLLAQGTCLVRAPFELEYVLNPSQLWGLGHGAVGGVAFQRFLAVG